MSNLSNSFIPIKLQLEDENEEELIDVYPGTNLVNVLLAYNRREVLALCYGENQEIILTGNNVIVKEKGVFFLDKEICSLNELNYLPIKVKRIGFDVSNYQSQSQKFEYSVFTDIVAVLIQDETFKSPKFISFYEKMWTWKKEVRKMLKSDTDLVFIDPEKGGQVKAFLGPKESKNGAHDSTFDDIKKFSHLVFISKSEKFEGIENIKIENESFNVIPIGTISKFILKESPSDKAQIENRISINSHPVLESFKANFNQLKLNSVDFIRAHACVYSFLYKSYTKFYTPMACLCQCSGAGKSKSSTTALKETPGFYVCVREPGTTSLAVPKANSITKELLDIFLKNYIADTFEDQTGKLCKESTVGKCLMFVAQSIKSYIVTVAKNLAEKLDVNDDEATLNEKFLSTIKNFSSDHFETPDNEFNFFSTDSMQKDFLKAKATSDHTKLAIVSHVVNYILEILNNAENCFKFDNELEKELLEPSSKLGIACKAISSKITKENPFLFFLDEAGLLSKMNGFTIKTFQSTPEGNYSAFQIFRRALSYLDINTNIFFFALGTKSSIEDLSPPIIDNSFRGLSRTEFFNPIIITQDFDIWREIYPLNEMVPCYKTMLNCCMFKFLATLGHPMFSSLNFDNIVDLTLDKLYNGSKNSDKTFLLATWMIRGGLACDPKSVLAGSLVENHMATLFNINALAPSSTQQSESSSPTFGNVGSGSYDITYQSNPCLALSARLASMNLGIENNSEFFEQLERKIESMVVDRGKLGEATGGLMTALLIDKLQNVAKTTLTQELIQEMKSLTPERFHPLWEAKGSLLCPEIGPLINSFDTYKVATVESFLKTLMGEDDFERRRITFPAATLNGLINASHFVSISRIDESAGEGEEAHSLPNANDFVSDKFRNVITIDRLRLALARQCGLIMPPNYYGIDAIIPVCLAQEEVIDPAGNVTIKDVNRDGKNEEIPYNLYDPGNEAHHGKNRYRPIYSFLAIQYKSGSFNLDAVPKMQARLHLVPCNNFSVEDETGKHRRCPKCVSEEALKAIFDNQISLLYCFLPKGHSTLKKQLTVNYGVNMENPIPPTSSESFDDIDCFFKTLYPKISDNEVKIFKEETSAKLIETTAIRTCEDFFLRHRLKVNENIELINIYCDDNQGCTYLVSDLKKFENSELKRLKVKRKLETEGEGEEKTRNYSESQDIQSLVSEFKKTKLSVDQSAESTTSYPKPLSLSTTFAQSRMSTVVINGWKPWEPIIGKKGTVMAEKLFEEFVQDPLKTVNAVDLKLLLPSLKIIMSSKLLGIDRYLDPENEKNDLTFDDWIILLFEKNRSFRSPETNKIYQSSLKNRKRKPM